MNDCAKMRTLGKGVFKTGLGGVRQEPGIPLRSAESATHITKKGREIGKFQEACHTLTCAVGREN